MINFLEKTLKVLKRFSVQRDLGVQLMVLYIVFVGLVVGTTFVFASRTRERLERDIKAADLALARSIAQETDYNMRNALRAVRDLGEYSVVIDPDSVGMEDLFSKMMGIRPDYSSIYRLNGQGFMLYHFPDGTTSVMGQDLSDQAFYQRAKVTTRPLISKGGISPVTRQPVATAVMPLWSQRARFMGLVATNIKLASLSITLDKITQEYEPEEEFLVIIVDSTQQIIAHPDENQILTMVPDNLTNVTETVLLGRADNLIEADSSGKEFLYSFVPVSSAGWGVIVSRPTETAFATSRSFYRGVLLILGLFFIAGVLFWTSLYRQAIRPLGYLTAFSQRIGRTEKPSAEQRRNIRELSNRSDQVGYLTRSLERMELAIEARLTELSTLLKTSAAVLSSLDSQTVLHRILEQLEQVLNVDKSAIVALDDRREVFRVQASNGFPDNYIQALAISPNEPNSITSRAINEKMPIQVSDTETDSLYNLPYKRTRSTAPNPMTPRERARLAGYRSILAIPLNTLHTNPSALLVFRPRPHHFSEREITLLSNFANQAAMAIENAALFARSDTRLQEQTRRLQALIQSLNDGLILGNLAGQIIYANRRACEWVGQHHDDVVGAPLDRFIQQLLQNTDKPGAAEAAINAAIASRGSQIAEITIRFQNQEHHLRLRTFDVTDERGIPIGYGQIIHDITADFELDRLKSSLISTVSHELRTPLASIKGYTTTLLADDVEWDAESQKEFLSIISTETDRLSNLVSDLLDLSRFEAGSLVIEKIECDISALIKNAARIAHPQPGERLRIDIATELPFFQADPRRLEVILRNLIENATKYSEPNSLIRVSAFSENGNIVVKVEDEGPGIPEGESDRIFDRFYRLEENLHNPNTGFGLGLSICQGFIKAHGGEIWADPCKTGACISFSIPFEPGI